MCVTTNLFGLSLLFVLLLSSCKKDEKTPLELLEGKWTITSQEILATVYPGDGSYLKFDACSSTCSGIDYKASDGTSGSLTYSLNEAGTVLTITDNDPDGGSWGASWDILELTEDKLRMTASTILGSMKVEMSK